MTKTTKRIAINKPALDEIVGGGSYVIKVHAEPSIPVEVSVDGGSWTGCSYTAGCWSMPLSGLAAGEHKLAARLFEKDKAFIALRRFLVAR